MELKANWFRADSIHETLTNLIESFDKNYLKSVPKDTFEKDLVREVLFLSAYKKKEEDEVVDFIHKNVDQLYDFANSIAGTSKKPAGR